MPILPIAWKRYLTCCGLLLPVNYWWYLALPVSEIYKNVLLWGKLPLRSQIFSLLLMRTRAKKIAGRYYELLPGVPSQPGKARGENIRGFGGGAGASGKKGGGGFFRRREKNAEN